jgi:DNA repair exonuclease SbcCD ATPase subunit
MLQKDFSQEPPQSGTFEACITLDLSLRDRLTAAEVRQPRSDSVAVGYARAVDESQDEGLKQRLQRQGEEALGKLAEELVGNPLVTGALQRAFEAREKAVAAQNVAMGALNIPSAADIERLTRRLRSVSQRLEAIEDTLDRVEERMQAVAAATPDAGGQEEQVLARLEEVARDIAALREALAPDDQPVPRAQERLSVSE